VAEPLSESMRDLLALSLVPGLGPRLTAALLRRFGTAAAVRRASLEQLQEVPHIGEKLSYQFVEALRQLDLKAEIELIEKHNVRLLAHGDPGYPKALAGIEDPPPMLYYRGTWAESDTRAVGVVGSRHCTSYGRRMAERMASGLARAGFTVVSGLARGIDGAAHRAALDAGGRTIAVLAGGLSEIYPPEHKDLSEAVEKSGCLVSETPMMSAPQAGMFPARNRIISGLSVAVVIVEASDRSGALITADHAAVQSREVFAVPGNVDSVASSGTLKLLRDGARLVRDADDILEDLAGLSKPSRAPAAKTIHPPSADPPTVPMPPAGLDETQRRLWDSLSDGPRHIDDLVRTLGVPVAQLNGMLMMLEMKKTVRRLPGNVYERR
jgi:DNA processing protein